jgi:hypothetical protein
MPGANLAGSMTAVVSFISDALSRSGVGVPAGAIQIISGNFSRWIATAYPPRDARMSVLP